jgi:hypothetical protein
MGAAMLGGRWDGGLFHVRGEGFEVGFALGSAEEIETVENVDVFVRLADGSEWTATVFTLAEVHRLMDRWAVSGEALGGKYFWCWDALFIRNAGVAAIVDVLAGLVASNEVHAVLRPVSHELGS